MKRTTFAFAATLALSQAHAANQPGVEAFFDAMAITAAPGQQSRFVAGDNLAGYFEGFTHSYDKGEGYVEKSGTVFVNYASFVGGAQNDRTRAIEQVLPYGHRVRYDSGATEEMALLSKKHAIAMTVTSPAAAPLSIRPLLKTAGAVTTAEVGLVLSTVIATVAPSK